MNTVRQHIRVLLSATAIAAPLVLGLMSPAAEARERAVQRTNAAGATIHRNTVRKMESGTVTSNSSRVGANGQVSTRTSTGTFDKEAGTWSRSAVTTGPNGKSSSLNADVVKTDNGYVRDATRVGPNGNSTSTHTEAVRTENGRSINTTVTGSNGGVSTRATDVVRTDTGSERNTVVTGPNGRSATANTVVTRTGDGVASSTVVTGPNGQTMSREGSTSYDADTRTLSRTSTTTGPNGNTATFNSTATRTEDGYVRDASRTGPNGNTVTSNTVGSYDADTQTATRSTTVTGPQGQPRSTVTSSTFTPAP